MTKIKSFCNLLIIICLTVFCIFGVLACSCSKGKYFVSSEYIMAHASLVSTTRSSDGTVEYGIDISHESDITLNYIKYKCQLYKDNKVIQTFKGEVPMKGMYSRYIPLKTRKEYDYARVICTGWSDENPENFVRLRAKSESEMQKCGHKDMIDAQIYSTSTNSKNDFMIINFNSQTIFDSFRFMYDDYCVISGDVKVCMSCGYYKKR